MPVTDKFALLEVATHLVFPNAKGMQRDLQIIAGLVKQRFILNHQEERQMSVVLWK